MTPGLVDHKNTFSDDLKKSGPDATEREGPPTGPLPADRRSSEGRRWGLHHTQSLNTANGDWALARCGADLSGSGSGAE
ncbi:MAG TPA: hypothetical protein VFF10_05905 [Trueperaceae bacterium]|nr:hypothetical protein [Trueperaceae bacterium]